VGDLSARRQAALTYDRNAVISCLKFHRRFGDARADTAIVRIGWQKGDGAEKAFIEC